MKRIVTNTVIVSLQLIIGFLFLFMIFSNNDNDSIVFSGVVYNDNTNKTSDYIISLYDENLVSKVIVKDITENNEIIEDDEVREELSITVDEPIDSEGTEVSEDVSNVNVESDNSEVNVDIDTYEENIEDTVVVSQALSSVDTSKYISNADKGFVVSDNNKVYNLSEEDFYTVASKVQCESHTNRNDILAVISVILNRSDMCYSGHCDPVGVVLQPYQFVCRASAPNDTVIEVVRDALNGIRNTKYTSFRSWGTSSYSDNYIVDGGNRYR